MNALYSDILQVAGQKQMNRGPWQESVPAIPVLACRLPQSPTLVCSKSESHKSVFIKLAALIYFCNSPFGKCADLP